MSKVERKKCFVITPIGKETDPIRRHIDGIIEAAIIPALGDKYDIIVAHKIATPGTITKQIINEIYSDDLVIANLTERNPNVMYELAFRHAIGKPMIMISEEDTNLPTDIIMERTIFYHNDAKGVLELRDALIKAEQAIDFSAKMGPIIDIMGDISHDTSVLENVNVKDKEPLEYIMNRLTKIEEAVLMSNRKNNTKNRDLVERRLRLAIDTDGMIRLDEDIRENIIDKLEKIGFNIHMFVLSLSDKVVRVSFTDNEARSYKATMDCFGTVFESFGIKINGTDVL
ncbi:MAG: hypothetical protein E7538_05055 [Ruminococcaceae bacterium]|nr:hypothetical protein [Oscillospiraceae bacterium]